MGKKVYGKIHYNCEVDDHCPVTGIDLVSEMLKYEGKILELYMNNECDFDDLGYMLFPSGEDKKEVMRVCDGREYWSMSKCWVTIVSEPMSEEFL